MRVLFQARPDCYTNPAGDTVQMVHTGNELKKLGIEVSLSTDPNLDLSPFDLVHIFNLTRIKESYHYFANAQKQKKKIVISPIYWNPQAFLQRPDATPNGLALWKHLQPMRYRLIKECDLLLPNSTMEMEHLKQDFLRTAPHAVIPNGFPDSYMHEPAAPQLIRTKYPQLPESYILNVARISPRKNQEALARACEKLDLPLVLAGPVNDKNYCASLLAHANVIYLGTLQGKELASAYVEAKAHTLPSWFETPGLSSLEAGAAGTVVISTDQGSPKEYFLDMAFYINPMNEETITQALSRAAEASPLPLMRHIQTHYPWSAAAEKTLNAYKRILA